MKIKNPILKGFYPDPSVCRANGKYYMVCSSFQFFPGVPLFESDDLINWKQIGHCITRSSQIDLKEVNSSGGVFAPTIRYNDGVFYMVTTNDTYHQNFYITTTDIYGEWSEPIFVEQGGIDPSLYFEDGKTYFMSNGSDEDGNGCIFQCEIDVKTGKKLTESTPLWKGSGGRYLESPHLYKFGDWYYLMAAEGGTEYGHMITYARGKSPYGPFENYEKNPVLTNRNLGGHQSTIQGIGHGDLVQDDEGNTYLFCLGFRQEGMWIPYHHLGREVFMAPVQWDENGWFTAGDNGIVTEEMEVPLSHARKDFDYSVNLEKLAEDSCRITYLREPVMENYELSKDMFKLRGTKTTLFEVASPTFAGIRQSEFKTELKCKISTAKGEAGITYYMDQGNHYDLYVEKSGDEAKVSLRICIAGFNMLLKSMPAVIDDGKAMAEIKVVSDEYNYHFFSISDGKEEYLGGAQTKYLSSEVCGGFTGVVTAFYAVNPEGTGEWAEFTEYEWIQ
ncbi:MAG: family 43 glycosylhydrolase [Lachnospiraceae bacterium]|nr:family 43 glycosylhydrolase [Lachnospiraceae bacterium]